jgi:hypothetical protein
MAHMPRRAARRDSFVPSLLLALGCLHALCACDVSGLGGKWRPCSKENCDGDRARLSGGVSLSKTQPFHYEIEICADAECRTYAGTAPAGTTWYDGAVFLHAGCGIRNEELGTCHDDDHWYISVVAPVTAPDDGMVASHRVTITDLDSGQLLLEREFVDPHYTTAEPTNCDDNADAISCTHTDANWD